MKESGEEEKKTIHVVGNVFCASFKDTGALCIATYVGIQMLSKICGEDDEKKKSFFKQLQERYFKKIWQVSQYFKSS